VLTQAKQPISAGDAHVEVAIGVSFPTCLQFIDTLYATRDVGDRMDVALMTAIRVPPTLEQELERDNCLPGNSVLKQLNRMKPSRNERRSSSRLGMDAPAGEIGTLGHIERRFLKAL
jgi:hypothetical protein